MFVQYVFYQASFFIEPKHEFFNSLLDIAEQLVDTRIFLNRNALLKSHSRYGESCKQNRQSLIAMQLSDGNVNGRVATSLEHDVNSI